MTEKQRMVALLDGFRVDGSEGEKLIEYICSPMKIKTISQNQMLAIAQILSALIDEDLKREHRRSKKYLIKWFNDNSRLISNLLFVNDLKFTFQYNDRKDTSIDKEIDI